MSARRRNFLSMLDNAVRWTGMSARVADQMSPAPSADARHRPLRWIPLWLIASSCVLFVFSLIRPSVLLTSLGSIVGTMALGIHVKGPLGSPWLEDDEREAALRKDSFLFCFGLLAFLNCVGQLLLLPLSHLHHWQTDESVFVAPPP